MNFTVNKSINQTKAICLTQNHTLEKIYYISIEDYEQLPLEFIRPFNDGDNIIIDTQIIPVFCSVMRPKGDPREKALSINPDTFGMTAKPAALRVGSLMEWISYHNLFWSNAIKTSLEGFIYQPNVSFSCSAVSEWEPEISTTFRAVRPGM